MRLVHRFCCFSISENHDVPFGCLCSPSFRFWMLLKTLFSRPEVEGSLSHFLPSSFWAVQRQPLNLEVGTWGNYKTPPNLHKDIDVTSLFMFKEILYDVDSPMYIAKPDNLETIVSTTRSKLNSVILINNVKRGVCNSFRNRQD